LISKYHRLLNCSSFLDFPPPFPWEILNSNWSLPTCVSSGARSYLHGVMDPLFLTSYEAALFFPANPPICILTLRLRSLLMSPVFRFWVFQAVYLGSLRPEEVSQGYCLTFFRRFSGSVLRKCFFCSSPLDLFSQPLYFVIWVLLPLLPRPSPAFFPPGKTSSILSFPPSFLNLWSSLVSLSREAKGLYPIELTLLNCPLGEFFHTLCCFFHGWWPMFFLPSPVFPTLRDYILPPVPQICFVSPPPLNAALR